MLDLLDIVTLSDDNKYRVVSKVKREDKVYYYLVDENNMSNVKFCVEGYDNGKLTMSLVTDKNVLKDLIRMFSKEIQKEIKE